MMNNVGVTSEVAVVVSGLHVNRGSKAVFDGLELAIPRGQITGLLGPSGCGKTTLMRAIVGVQKTAGGTVTVLGEPAGSRQLRSRVSYATQAASVYDDLTVAQNLSYFASVTGSRRTDVAAIINRVGLTAQAKQKVESLSGGQKNRVSLAVAMLGNPEVLVLDEPTVGLDPVLREELWVLFRSLADSGATLFVSSHVMDEAMRCDRLILMREGHVIANTTPPELLSETGTHDADAAFLALIERGDEAGSERGNEAGSAPGTERGSERAAERGSERGSERGTQPARERGTERGTQPARERGIEPGNRRSSELGSKPASTRATEPGIRELHTEAPDGAAS